MLEEGGHLKSMSIIGSHLLKNEVGFLLYPFHENKLTDGSDISVLKK